MPRNTFSLIAHALIGLTLVSCQNGPSENLTAERLSSTPVTVDSPTTPDTSDNQQPDQAADSDADSQDIADHIFNEQNSHAHTDGAISDDILAAGCLKASSSQKESVGLGLTKKEEFLQLCNRETNGSHWCSEIVRPNPRSASTFRCTYGSSQSHVLIHPNERTWKYPIAAVKIIQDLEAKGISVRQIYNWWRPEPYNKNVGGAAGRHPYGTSVDVRFSSSGVADRAFRELCTMRKQGRLRAIGHYGSSSLHIGVGDNTANTWGKRCS